MQEMFARRGIAIPVVPQTDNSGRGGIEGERRIGLESRRQGLHKEVGDGDDAGGHRA